MSETVLYIVVFALIMFFMHRGHGSMGGCGGHAHHGRGQKDPDKAKQKDMSSKSGHVHHQ